MAFCGFIIISLLFVGIIVFGDNESIRYQPPISFLGHTNKPDLEYVSIYRDDTDATSVTIDVTPDYIDSPKGFANVEVKWMGNNGFKPNKNDWIGIYSPANATDNEYLDWFYSDGKSTGIYNISLWNMRSNYELRYFLNNGNGNYVLEGVSNIVTVNDKQPLQIHLSLTDNSPNEMQFRWVSTLIKNPMLQIGIQSGIYSNSIDATYYTYDTTYMCGSSASIVSPTQFRDPGYIYTAIASNLAENTTYYYRFGDSNDWSPEYTFRTGMIGSDDTWKFIMYGDQGTYTDAFPTIANIVKDMKTYNNIELLLHIGDLSYAWGNGYTWEIWSNMVTDISGYIPYMVSIGNHEYDHTSKCNSPSGLDVSGVGGNGYHPPWGNFGDDSNGECGAPSYFRYNASLGGPQSNSIFWYSFNYKSIHFIMLSSEHDLSSNSPAFNFLLNDLKSVNRDITPWVIVNIHRPLYESEIYSSDNTVSEHLVEQLEPTLLQYNVDVVLAGHFHAYQRTCSVANYKCVNNGGIVHVTIGTAGIGLDDAKYKNVDWTEFSDESDHGYARFTVNKTTLYLEYVTNNHGVMDTLTLTK